MLRENAKEYVESEIKNLKDFEQKQKAGTLILNHRIFCNNVELNSVYKEFNIMKINRFKQKSKQDYH